MRLNIEYIASKGIEQLKLPGRRGFVIKPPLIACSFCYDPVPITLRVDPSYVQLETLVLVNRKTKGVSNRSRIHFRLNISQFIWTPTPPLLEIAYAVAVIHSGPFSVLTSSFVFIFSRIWVNYFRSTKSLKYFASLLRYWELRNFREQIFWWLPRIGLKI